MREVWGVQSRIAKKKEKKLQEPVQVMNWIRFHFLWEIRVWGKWNCPSILITVLVLLKGPSLQPLQDWTSRDSLSQSVLLSLACLDPYCDLPGGRTVPLSPPTVCAHSAVGVLVGRCGMLTKPKPKDVHLLCVSSCPRLLPILSEEEVWGSAFPEHPASPSGGSWWLFPPLCSQGMLCPSPSECNVPTK